MSFQGNVKELIGTAASVATVKKHLDQQQESNALQAVSQGKELLNEATNIGADAEELQRQDNLIQSQISSNNNLLSQTNDNKLIAMYNQANQEAQKKVDAISAQKKQLGMRMDLYNKKLGAIKAIKRDVAPNLADVLTNDQLNAVQQINESIGRKGGNK